MMYLLAPIPQLPQESSHGSLISSMLPPAPLPPDGFTVNLKHTASSGK